MNSSNNAKKVVSRRRRNTRIESRSSITKALNGGKYTPSPNPPDVTAQPWYPLTLSWTSRPGTLTFTGLIANFKKQLDPKQSGLCQKDFDSSATGSFRVQFRFRRITVWNLTGRAISLTVWDDLEQNNTDKDQLGGWTDCGGASTFPKIGFVYPYSHSNRVHRPDELLKDTVVYQTTASAQSDVILVHFQLLWRFDGAVQVLGLIPSVEERVLTEIESITKAIKDNQPSTIDKIVDGAKVAASVVAIASGGASTSISDEDLSRLAVLVVEKLSFSERRTDISTSPEFDLVDES